MKALQRIGAGRITRRKCTTGDHIASWMHDVTFDLNYDFNSMWSHSWHSCARGSSTLRCVYFISKSLLSLIAGRFYLVFFVYFDSFCLCSQMTGSPICLCIVRAHCLYMGCRLACNVLFRCIILGEYILRISLAITHNSNSDAYSVYKNLLFVSLDVNLFVAPKSDAH